MSPPLRPRRPSMSPSAPTSSPAESPSTKKRKQGCCGECDACLREDCRQCSYCLDMRKYGGPNKLRKRCLYRRCTAKEDVMTKRTKLQEEEPDQITKSKRVIKQPKKLTPNHSAALSYDDTNKDIGGELQKSPSQSNVPPHAKRRKLDYTSKEANKPEFALPKSYGSGKRLSPLPPIDPTPIPSPPKLFMPPSPIITRVTRHSKLPIRNTRSSSKVIQKKYVPKSLPFLVQANIASVIVHYEVRARNSAVLATRGGDGKEKMKNQWKLEEVINFFRGLYLFGKSCYLYMIYHF